LTGGHITPALAFIEYVQSLQAGHELAVVGREIAQQGTAQPAVEKQLVKEKEVTFFPLQTGKRVANGGIVAWGEQAALFVRGVRDARRIVALWKPDVLVSFGSYVAVPVSLACALERIPIITHEQTQTISLATKLIALMAQKVAVSFPEQLSSFSQKKVEWTGNLVRDAIVSSRTAIPMWLPPLDPSKPLVYIAGGSQGSQFLNKLVWQALPFLLPMYQVVHQVGQNNMPSELPPMTAAQHYCPRTWIAECELSWLYRHAHVVISRSGANTVWELAISGTPSILIPLPHAAADEQLKNAQWLARAGGAVLLNQDQAVPHTLLTAIEWSIKQRTLMQRNLEGLSTQLPRDADRRLFDVMRAVCQQ
jgi:UDP-N-acetylglucosamine--N-acetylmuramyl-(pentapeptide) pyrophosphoryl-undecaprenol N-acetylglucosamine transferase